MQQGRGRKPRFLDKIAREIFRPIWRHAAIRMEPRLSAIEAASGVRGGNGGLAPHLPAFLNAIRSVRAFGFELRNLRKELDAVVRRLDDATTSVGAADRTDATGSDQGVSARAPAPSPLQLYQGYDAGDVELLRRHARPHLESEADYIVDFIGGRTHRDALWREVQHLVGTVSDLPVPADYHSEAIEWVGVLKSVDSARSRFVAMELGAGWGPWIVAGGIAARNAGICDIRLTGVEAEPGRFRLMRRHLADNGFDPDAHTLIQAAIGAENGRVRWPAIAEPAEAGGARPTRDGNAGDLAYNGAGRGGIDIDMLAFSDLLAREQQWDLVHLDIQGWEADVCESSRDLLSERVRWLVVGTHSRVLEGRMMALMWSLGWHLENEKPSRFAFGRDATSLERMTTVDGTQVWCNPHWNVGI